MMTYVHISYMCGNPDRKDTLWGDTIIRFNEGVTIENIREWLLDDIKDKKGEGWNIPTLLEFQVLNEKLALQLSPEFINDVRISDYERGYASGMEEGKRLGKIETLESIPMWHRFSNDSYVPTSVCKNPENGREVLQSGNCWIYVDELRNRLELDD